MAQLVAKRYAKALFELALEKNELDELSEQMAFVQSTLKSEETLLGCLNHPEIPYDEKFSIVQKVFESYVSNDILGLFKVVFHKNREVFIMDIIEAFISMSKKYKGIVTAYVYAPRTIPDDKLSVLSAKLSQKINKQVEIQFELQPELIGGIRIMVDGNVIDGSIQKQLADMKKHLLNLQLA